MNHSAVSSASYEVFMLISDLAQEVGLPISTIRFYERQGLLNSEHYERQRNGYRIYNESAVQRIRLIQRAQLAGVTLREMKMHIADWEQNSVSAAQKRAFFLRKLETIEARIAAWAHIREYVESKLEALESVPSVDG